MMENRFALIGNQAIKDLKKEILKRLFENVDEDWVDPEGNNRDSDVIGKVFYGKVADDGQLGVDIIGSHAGYLNTEDRDTIVFWSSQTPLFGLQDHISKCISSIDAKAIVLLDFADHFQQRILGSRYTYMKDGFIQSFEAHGSGIKSSNYFSMRQKAFDKLRGSSEWIPKELALVGPDNSHRQADW